MPRKKRRGGKRPGAGRPSTGKNMGRITITLPVDLLEAVDLLAYGESEKGVAPGRSAVIADLLKKALKK